MPCEKISLNRDGRYEGESGCKCLSIVALMSSTPGEVFFRFLMARESS